MLPYLYADIINMLKQMPIEFPLGNQDVDGLIPPLLKWLSSFSLVRSITYAPGALKGVVRFDLATLGAMLLSDVPAAQKLQRLDAFCFPLKPDREYYELIVRGCSLAELPIFLSSNDTFAREAAKEYMDSLEEEKKDE